MLEIYSSEYKIPDSKILIKDVEAFFWNICPFKVRRIKSI